VAIFGTIVRLGHFGIPHGGATILEAERDEEFFDAEANEGLK
jgi:hypothetical protein